MYADDPQEGISGLTAEVAASTFTESTASEVGAMLSPLTCGATAAAGGGSAKREPLLSQQTDLGGERRER